MNFSKGASFSFSGEGKNGLDIALVLHIEYGGENNSTFAIKRCFVLF
jgi:hypothetical protein